MTIFFFLLLVIRMTMFVYVFFQCICGGKRRSLEGRNAQSTLQAPIKNVEDLEGMIKKRQIRARLKQRRKEPLTCNKCGIPGLISFGCRK